MSIQGQLTDNGQRLDKLRSELKKYQVTVRAHLRPQGLKGRGGTILGSFKASRNLRLRFTNVKTLLS